MRGPYSVFFYWRLNLNYNVKCVDYRVKTGIPIPRAEKELEVRGLSLIETNQLWAGLVFQDFAKGLCTLFIKRLQKVFVHFSSKDCKRFFAHFSSKDCKRFCTLFIKRLQKVFCTLFIKRLQKVLLHTFHQKIANGFFALLLANFHENLNKSVGKSCRGRINWYYL